MSDNAMIVVIIVQFILLGLLLYCIYLVTSKGHTTTFVKWVMLISSIGILALADKFKLIAWSFVMAAAWIIRYKKKKNELT